MSYCRWSTIINSELTAKEEAQLMIDRIPLEDRAKAAGPNAEVSDWYIYWHNDCEGQEPLLALWNCKSSTTPIFTYEEVKKMYEEDDWSTLEVVTQKEFMRECVKNFLKDVEKEIEKIERLQ